MVTQTKETTDAIAALKQRLSAAGFTPFTPPRKLGSGAYGTVELYQYTGSDASVLALCDKEGRIGVKLSSPPDEQEATIATHLLKKRNELGSAFKADFNTTSPLSDNQGLIGILTQYETYGTRVVNGKKQECSDNLENFISKASNPDPDSLNKLTNAVQSGFNQDTGIMMSQMAGSMQQSQQSFSNLGLFHRDIATRNFLPNATYDSKGNVLAIKARLSDYGRTFVVPDGVTSIKMKENDTGPLRWMDSGSVFDRETTIKTDIFGLKVSMIGMMGMMANPGSTEGQNLSYDKSSEIDLNAYGDQRVAQYHTAPTEDKNVRHDSQLLNTYLFTLQKNIANCPSPERKAELITFYQCYQEYLSSMPSTIDIKKAQREDAWLLQKAHQNFATRSLERLAVKSEANDPSVLLSLQRLQQIPITDVKLQAKITAAIETEQAKQLKQDTPLPNVEVIQTVQASPEPSRIPSIYMSINQEATPEPGPATQMPLGPNYGGLTGGGTTEPKPAIQTTLGPNYAGLSGVATPKPEPAISVTPEPTNYAPIGTKPIIAAPKQDTPEPTNYAPLGAKPVIAEPEQVTPEQTNYATMPRVPEPLQEAPVPVQQTPNVAQNPIPVENSSTPPAQQPPEAVAPDKSQMIKDRFREFKTDLVKEIRSMKDDVEKDLVSAKNEAKETALGAFKDFKAGFSNLRKAVERGVEKIEEAVDKITHKGP